MPLDTRESLLLVETIHDLYRARKEGRVPSEADLLALHQRAQRVDTGIAGSMVLARTGADAEDMRAIARRRDALRKRRERAAA